MLRMMSLIALLGTTPALADGPSDGHAHAGHDHAHGDEAHHLTEAGDMRLIHAWAAEGATPLLVYVEIQNTGATEAVLTGAEADWASFDIVAPVLRDGAAALVTLDDLPVPAQSTLDLAPGSVAIRAQDLAQDLHEGHVAHLHLHFADGLAAEIDVEILPRGTTRHPHAGHVH